MAIANKSRVYCTCNEWAAIVTTVADADRHHAAHQLDMLTGAGRQVVHLPEPREVPGGMSFGYGVEIRGGDLIDITGTAFLHLRGNAWPRTLDARSIRSGPTQF